MATRKRDQGRRRDVQGAAQRYGKTHRKLRAQWDTRVQQGHTPCARCGKPIQPGTPWHLDHHDNPALGYLGPAHATCNVTAAVNKLNNKPKPTTTSRQW